MGQFLGFGNGSDGAATLSGTQAPTDASCSGSSGATSLSATNPSFAANQMILVIQMRGTGVGGYEVNKIASYVAGTITTVLPLANTYTDSGASQAQVIVLPQYSSVTISATFTVKAWDGNVGGVSAFLCTGRVTITGTHQASGGNGSVVLLAGTSSGGKGTGGGFRGGDANVAPGEGNGFQGEGTDGAGTQTWSANGNGGGGGRCSAAPGGNPGGGAGHSAAGNPGQKDGSGEQGRGGSAVGVSDLTTLIMGGGGGGGGREETNNVGGGGSGGGIIFIMCDYIDCSAGYILVNGGNGGNVSDRRAGGGGGAGGSVLIKARTAVLGTNRITASGGSGDEGGEGATGRIRVEACTLSGTTNPSNSATAGGYSWCVNYSAIL